MLGDGTFGFHASELDTAVRHSLAYVAVVGNDACWNAERQIQLRAYGAARARGCELLPARYDRVAEGFGAHGEHVERASELAPALGRAARAGRAACVNVTIASVAAPTYRPPSSSAAGGVESATR
jgi:acetolactate synthase-1/2/3 large subunit